MTTLPSWMQPGACSDSEFAALQPSRCTGEGTIYSLKCPYGQCAEGNYTPPYGSTSGTCIYYEPGDTIERKHICYLLNKLKDTQRHAQEFEPVWGTRSNICEFADPQCKGCTRGAVVDNNSHLGGDGEISELYASTAPTYPLTPGNYGSGGTEYDEDVCSATAPFNGVCHYLPDGVGAPAWRSYIYTYTFTPSSSDPETAEVSVAYWGSHNFGWASSVRVTFNYLDITGYVKIWTNCASVIYRTKRLSSFTTIELPISPVNGDKLRFEIYSTDNTDSGVQISGIEFFCPPWPYNDYESWTLPDNTNFGHGIYDSGPPYFDYYIWLEVTGLINTAYGDSNIKTAADGFIGAGGVAPGTPLDDPGPSDVPDPPGGTVDYYKSFGSCPYNYHKERPIYDGTYTGYRKGTSNNFVYISRGLTNLFNVLVEGWSCSYDRTPPTSPDLSYFTDSNNLARGTAVSGEYGTKNINYAASYDASCMRDFVVFKRDASDDLRNEEFPTPPLTGSAVLAKYDGTVELVEDVKFCWKPFSGCEYSSTQSFVSPFRYRETTISSPPKREYKQDQWNIYTGSGYTGNGSTTEVLSEFPFEVHRDQKVNPKFLTNSVPVCFPTHRADGVYSTGDGFTYYYYLKDYTSSILTDHERTYKSYGMDLENRPFSSRGYMASGILRNPRTFVIKRLYFQILGTSPDPVEFPDEVDLVEDDDFTYCKFTGRIVFKLIDEGNYSLDDNGDNVFNVTARVTPSAGTQQYKLRVNYLENPCPYGDCMDSLGDPAGWYVPRLSWGFLNFSAHPQGNRNVPLCEPGINDILYTGLPGETFWVYSPEKIHGGFLDSSYKWGTPIPLLWDTDNASASLLSNSQFYATELWRTIIWMRRYEKATIDSCHLPQVTGYNMELITTTYDFDSTVLGSARVLEPWYGPVTNDYYRDHPFSYYYVTSSGNTHASRYSDLVDGSTSIICRVLFNINEVVYIYAPPTGGQLVEYNYCCDPSIMPSTTVKTTYYQLSESSGGRSKTYKGRCGHRCLYAYEKSDGTTVKTYCRKSAYSQYDENEFGLFGTSKYTNTPTRVFKNTHDGIVTNVELSGRECANPNFCGGSVCFAVGNRTGPPTATADLNTYYSEPATPTLPTQCVPAYQLSYYAADDLNPRKHANTPILNEESSHPTTGTHTINLSMQSSTLKGRTINTPNTMISRSVNHRYVWVTLTAECDLLEIYEGTKLLRRYENVSFDYKRIDFIGYYPQTLKIEATCNTSKWGIRLDSLWTLADLTDDDIDWTTTVIPHWYLHGNVTSSNKAALLSGGYFNSMLSSNNHAIGHSDFLDDSAPDAGIVSQSFSLQHFYEPLLLPVLTDIRDYAELLTQQQWAGITKETWTKTVTGSNYTTTWIVTAFVYDFTP